MKTLRKLKHTVLLILSVAFVFSNRLVAQSLPGDFINHHKIYGVENGLSSREVFCGLQDKKGFLWFGTRNGLDRFDGENFKHYNKPKVGISQNKIVQLALDFQNRLFVLYGSDAYGRVGVETAVMDLSTCKMTDLKSAFPALPFNSKRVYWFDMDCKGNAIYFLLENPFQLWRLDTKGFKLICDMPAWDDFLKNDKVLSGNFKFNAFRNQFFNNYVVLFLNDNAPIYSINKAGKFAIDVKGSVPLGITSNNKVFTKFEDDFYLLNSIGKEQNPYQLIEPYIANCSASNFRSNAAYHQILFYNQQNGVFVSDYNSVTRILDPVLINSAGFILYSFFKDQRGMYWICTNSGIFKVHIEEKRFNTLFTNVIQPGLTSYEIRGILSLGNKTVLANQWQSLCYNEGGNSKSIKAPEINILFGMVRHNGNVYTAGKNLFKVISGYTTMLKIEGVDGIGDIWTLDSFDREKLLIGGEQGFYTYSLKTQKLENANPESFGFPKSSIVFRFIRRKNDTYWVVAQNGLYLVDFKGGKVLKYLGKNPKQPDLQFPTEAIHDAYEDPSGMLWLATYGKGLFQYNPITKQSKQFNVSNGFESDVLYRIEPDRYNNLWISSDFGIAKFNLKTSKTCQYTIIEGTSNNEFNRGSSCVGKNGMLYFGSINGVTYFNPADFIKDTIEYHAQIELLSFQKYQPGYKGLQDITESVANTNKIVINPNDHFFIFKFRLLDFETEHPQYAYFIEGVDPTWNLLSENQLRLGGLPYGEYTLRIRGRSNGGSWSANELRYKLIIKPPFFKTWWFLILSILIVGAVVFTIHKIRTKQLERSRLLLENTIAERTDELQKTLIEKDALIKEIHHRVKNNLQVIIGLMDLQAMDIENAKVKIVFEESKSRIHSIALVHYKLFQNNSITAIEISNFINDLYFQIASTFKKPNHLVNFEMEVPKTNLDIDTAVPFGVILNELLTNSFKYAFKDHIQSNIHIKLTRISESKFIFLYKDDGIGLPENINFEKLQTLGLKLIKLLSKQIGGTVTYNYNLGSEFVIEFKPRVILP